MKPKSQSLLTFYTLKLQIILMMYIASWTLALTVIFATQFSFAEDSPHSLINLGMGPYYSEHAIVVDKDSRTVSVWEQSAGGYKKLRQYEADFGKMSGDKISQGDHKTPEGIYEFTGLVEKASLNFQEYGYHEVKAFPMNYPNLFDRREGKTGAGIWLHAIPESAPLTRGSRGCVVLKKEDLEDIGQFIKVSNTPIIVNAHVSYLKSGDMQKQKEAIETWLKKWLESWQGKNLDQYMSYYDTSFRSKKMGFDQWREYKKGLADQRAEILVSISEPRVIRHKDEWVIQFFQKYRSNEYEDFGHKTLYIKGDINNLKILAEDFDVTESPTALAQFNTRNFSCCEGRALTNN